MDKGNIEEFGITVGDIPDNENETKEKLKHVENLVRAVLQYQLIRDLLLIKKSRATKSQGSMENIRWGPIRTIDCFCFSSTKQWWHWYCQDHWKAT